MLLCFSDGDAVSIGKTLWCDVILLCDFGGTTHLSTTEITITFLHTHTHTNINYTAIELKYRLCKKNIFKRYRAQWVFVCYDCGLWVL